MKQLLKSFVLFCLGACTMVSCGDEETPTKQEESTLEVSQTSLEFSKSADSKIITITSNSTWYVENTSDWISVSPMNGDENGVITVSVSRNTFQEERESSFSIKTDSNSKVIFVSQLAVDDEENGMQYVDLGLSVKWATCNIGANNPEEYGNYYAWGEVETKSTYDWSTYKYCEGDYQTQTKYCTNSLYGTVDNKTTLEKSDDVVYTTLGGNWRMPTDAEWTELRENCTWEWTTENGVTGCKVSAANGNSIFLPAAGLFYGSEVDFGDEPGGMYWSSSLNDSPDRAWYVSLSLYSYSYCNRNVYGTSRMYGLSVRPVFAE